MKPGPSWFTRFNAANLHVAPTRDVALFLSMLVSVALMFYAYIARMHAVTHDVFHEMALAREWFSSGSFPLIDVFAYTPTVSPTVHHEWGTGLILYFAAALSPLGIDGLAILKVAIVAAIGLTLYRVARGNGAHPVVFCLLAPVVFPLLWVGFATLRAQAFTLLAISLQLLMQQSDWHGRCRWVAAWAIMYLVWLNVHAGFVVGLGMMAFHIFERLLTNVLSGKNTRELFALHAHHLALILIVPIGVFCNPWGPEYVTYLYRAITMPRPTILEWQPIWFTYDPLTTMVVYCVSILMLILVLKERRLLRLRGWLFCMVAAYMALKHIRHGSIYAVIWIALVPAWISSTTLGHALIEWCSLQRVGLIRTARYVSILSLGFVVWNPVGKATIPQSNIASSFSYPIQAMDYLEKHEITGNCMTPFHCGAYVTWRLYPSIKVSLDGRYEVAFDEEVLPMHNIFYEALPGWEHVLSRYDHDLVLIPESSPVFSKVIEDDKSRLAGWRLAYQDAEFAILCREEIQSPYVDNR